ncbi:MAG: hypothetical protein R3F43_06350 [bacterium]
MVLLILAACSGTGKSTLGGATCGRVIPGFGLGEPHHRRPRPGEADGVDYHFVDRAAFEAEIERGGFVEWAEYAGNLTAPRRARLAAADECSARSSSTWRWWAPPT